MVQDPKDLSFRLSPKSAGSGHHVGNRRGFSKKATQGCLFRQAASAVVLPILSIDEKNQRLLPLCFTLPCRCLAAFVLETDPADLSPEPLSPADIGARVHEYVEENGRKKD